jgi:hypothetical protein
MIDAHILHHSVCLGRNAVKKDSRTLRLGTYLTPSKAADYPDRIDWTQGTQDFGTMLNTEIGDCTIAALAHQIQIWTLNTDGEITVPDSDILTFYEAVSGYTPDHPSSDVGAAELDVLNTWRQSPFDGNVLQAFVSVPYEAMLGSVKTAISLFGGCYVGLALPLTAQSQTVWTTTGPEGDNVPGSWGGHAVCLVGYDPSYAYCITWGGLKAMTWGFFSAYCEEAYALLSPDWISKGTGISPSDFDFAQLESDLTQIAQAKGAAS